MKIIFEWKEGRNTRRTETELPSTSWEEQKEFIRKALYIAYKYSEEEYPKDLLRGEEVI